LGAAEEMGSEDTYRAAKPAHGGQR
jgi:hypothetical protein